MAHPLIDRLIELNAKERFFLVRYALGSPGIQLGSEFRADMGRAIAIGDDVPKDAFCAMDYHLDWIHAAIHSQSCSVEAFPPQPRNPRCIAGSQEDVDLLVAFAMDDKVHMVFVEAKATTGWASKQMNSKARRLRSILGHNNEIGSYFGIVPHFVLVSPGKAPTRLVQQDKKSANQWPSWMLREDQTGCAKLLHLKLPTDKSLLKVSRCDKRGRAVSNGATHWKLISR